MKLINQSAQYLPQQAGIDGIYKQIELAGRTSYLSWDKMTDDSAKKFVDMLIKSKHTSVLEHGTVYLKLPIVAKDKSIPTVKEWWPIVHSPYSKSNDVSLSNDPNDLGNIDKMFLAITTNLRVLLENNMPIEHISKYLCEPTEFHEKRLSVKVVTSRSISHELVRHRSMSFIQESQRYVGYDNRFGEITYIKPSWLWHNIPCGTVYYHDGINYRIMPDENEPEDFISVRPGNDFTEEEAVRLTNFFRVLDNAEYYYKKLKKDGLKSQEAREVLPNATKTTLVITAFESDWREWFAQRLFGKTGEPHPDMLVLANLIKEEFEKAGVWEEIMKYPSKYD